MKNSLNISVKEETRVVDQLVTYKRWFNGIKKFFTVKLLPPTRK